MQIQYAGPFRRSAAALIDILIAGFLMAITAQISAKLWLEPQIWAFMVEFKAKFGTSIIGNNPVHLHFLLNHLIFKMVILFILLLLMVSAFYYSLLNCSSWSATIGKRIMAIVMVNTDENRIGFGKALAHYFLSLIPALAAIYLMLYLLRTKATIYEALTNNHLNLFLGFIILIWTQSHIVTKKKAAIPDLICQIAVLKGKRGGKLPSWNKR